MQSYLIFSCHRIPFLLKKVKTLFINCLEKLKIDDCEDQKDVNAFIEPSRGCVVKIIRHANGDRGNRQKKMAYGPICIEVKRYNSEHKHAEKQLKRLTDMHNAFKEILTQRKEKQYEDKDYGKQYQVVVDIDVYGCWEGISQREPDFIKFCHPVKPEVYHTQ